MPDKPTSLTYQLVRSKRKTIALIIQPDGTLVVRAPLRLANKQIQAIVEDKADWIQRKQNEMLVLQAQKPVRSFSEGATFLYLGQAYPLHLVDKGQARLSLRGNAFYLRQDAQAQARKHFETWYQTQARQIFAQRVAHYAASSGLQPKEIKLSAARTRWGSCSSRGVVRLAWRLVLAPLAVIDYVVAHELAHLAVHNHSAQFWVKVEQIYPTYRPARAWLKKNGQQLTLD